MNSVKTLVAEHENILRFNCVVRAACLKVLQGEEICDKDFRSMIEFVRDYADKHHHGKEEKILFKEMTAHLGRIGENLIIHGMMVEHDLARLYIANLETALDTYQTTPSQEVKLDIIASAIGYTKLLQRHIDKENEVIYPYAEKNLPGDVMTDANARMEAVESQAQEKGVQRKYLDVLTDLESKYK